MAGEKSISAEVVAMSASRRSGAAAEASRCERKLETQAAMPPVVMENFENKKRSAVKSVSCDVMKGDVEVIQQIVECLVVSIRRALKKEKAEPFVEETCRSGAGMQPERYPTAPKQQNGWQCRVDAGETGTGARNRFTMAKTGEKRQNKTKEQWRTRR